MTNRLPDYLRLHTDDVETPAVNAPEQHVFSMDVLCQKFTEVTGVDLQYGSRESLPSELGWFMEVEDSRPGPTKLFAIQAGGNQERPPEQERQIENLAGEIGWLADRLNRTERALWEREAELAVGIPVTAHYESECEQIAVRLESILRCGVLAVGCSAGALYLLDEATTELKLRSHWGFDNSAFTEPARVLRGARADLEALTGHAVVVEKRDHANYWGIPDEFEAAVCIPISTMAMPLGTLWIYSETARPFSDLETNLIEIIAGRLTVELEREVLIRDIASRRHGAGLAGAITWQQQMVPTNTPVADRWDFAAATSYENSLNGDHCFWHSRGDGRVFATISSVLGHVPEIALTSALVAGAVRGQCESRLVADVVSSVNRTLWSSSDGDLLASIFAGEVDPQSGKLRFVATGDIGVFIVRPHGWEEIKIDRPHCGSDAELDLTTVEQQLKPDDILIVFSSPRSLSPRLASNAAEMQHMAEIALLHTHLTASKLIDLLRQEWKPTDVIHHAPPAMLVVKRQ